MACVVEKRLPNRVCKDVSRASGTGLRSFCASTIWFIACLSVCWNSDDRKYCCAAENSLKHRRGGLPSRQNLYGILLSCRRHILYLSDKLSFERVFFAMLMVLFHR